MARLLVLMVAAVLGLSGCGGGSSSTPSAAPPPVVAGAFRCPDAQAPVTTEPADDTLPSGARAALLCFHDNHVAWIPPSATLTTGLDDLVGLVNAQRVHDPSSDVGCGGVGAPAWTMVFRYQSGIRTISGDNGGCWDLLVGHTQRFGSREVYDAYLHALLEQRHAEGTPTAMPTHPACPRRVRTDDAFSPVADAARLTSAVMCTANGTKVVATTRLTHAQLAALRRDVATATPRRTVHDFAARCAADGTEHGGAIVGMDDWGDPVTMLIVCDTYRTVQPGSERYLFARMLPSTARMVQRLLAA